MRPINIPLKSNRLARDLKCLKRNQNLKKLVGIIENKIKSGESRWQRRYERSVGGSVVVEFEERRGDQFEVFRDTECGWKEGNIEFSLSKSISPTFRRQLHKEQLCVLFGFGHVRRDVGIAWRVKVWSPPVADLVLDGPLVRFAVGPAQSLVQQTFDS